MIYAFVGGAGTGKTHALVEAVAGYQSKTPVRADQRVLGLTFMHGSRRRMESRLKALGRRAPPYRVATLDAFALDLVRRFRRYCGMPGEIRPAFDAGDQEWEHEAGVWRAGLDAIRQEGQLLLDRSAVQSTVSAAYPMIILDEVQDCDGPLLGFVQRLAKTSLFVCAGDPFQYLTTHESSPAIDWLEGVAEVRHLETQRRTSNVSVLETATALRGGHPVTAPSVEVVEVKAAGLAAYQIQRRLIWGKWRGSAALICPTQPARSKFFRGVLKSLRTSKVDDKLGPRPFVWEGTAAEELAATVDAACAPFAGTDSVSAMQIRQTLDAGEVTGPGRDACRSLLRRLRLAGRDDVTLHELEEAVRLTAHAKRMYRTPGDTIGRRAMTIHGAKNREFDYVFVLWPYEIQSDAGANRRLLYNAVTRARVDAVILVQGEGRIASDPVLRDLTYREGSSGDTD